MNYSNNKYTYLELQRFSFIHSTIHMKNDEVHKGYTSSPMLCNNYFLSVNADATLNVGHPIYYYLTITLIMNIFR